jgi:hypothetical protein
MKYKVLTLFIIKFGLTNCQNKTFDSKKELLKPTEIKLKEGKPTFSNIDFELVFEYSNGEDNQLLGVNFIDKKNIKFHLVTKTIPCDTEYWGKAEDKYSKFASEVDEDENGTAYGAIEYSKKEKEYLISIRMALDSSKVQINYTEENIIESDCLPITKVIMKRIK